jgi:hypothetical protein
MRGNYNKRNSDQSPNAFIVIMIEAKKLMCDITLVSVEVGPLDSNNMRKSDRAVSIDGWDVFRVI